VPGVIGFKENPDRGPDKAAVASTRAARAFRDVGVDGLVREGRKTNDIGLIEMDRESQPLVEMVPDGVSQIPLREQSAADSIDPGLVRREPILLARVARVPR
jgi:hypothetical protein